MVPLHRQTKRCANTKEIDGTQVQQVVLDNTYIEKDILADWKLKTMTLTGLQRRNSETVILQIIEIRPVIVNNIFINIISISKVANLIILR